MRTTIDIVASNLTKSRTFELQLDPDARISEVVDALIAESNAFARQDAQGRPLSYRLRLEGEGRHLHASEIVGQALRSGDRVTATPNIDAGSRPR